MNDLSLVDRLRYSGLGASWGALCKEAADALESQAAEIADLKRIRVAVIAQRDALRGALTDLYRGYVNTLENSRDRIRMLGGECDDVPRMEASDTHLRAARAALAARAQEKQT